MTNSTYPANLSLSPDQENLLMNALNSNPRASPPVPRANRANGHHRDSLTSPLANGSDSFTSPNQDLDGQLLDSPLFDGAEDGNFEWDNDERLFGDVEYDETGEIHDKRKQSAGSEEGDNKRQEGDSKTPKKPGRKPLTAEPTTKRKAQNRAAQRAFRERKERHLKDLEVKVDDLEKASEATNHENGRLRAQVEKLNTELKEYRKRFSLSSTANHSPPTQSPNRSLDSGDFTFAFPKFGDLPASFMSNGSMAKTSTALSQAPTANAPVPGRTLSSNSGTTATSSSVMNPNLMPQTTASPQALNPFTDASLNELTGLFSPSVLETASRSNSTDYGFPSSGGSLKNAATTSNSSLPGPPKSHRASSASITNSPASSMRFDSSVGTTPEPTGDSPSESQKPDPVLKTISEEGGAPPLSEGQRKFSEAMSSACGTCTDPVPKSPSANPNLNNGIDWMAQQNGGTFDPVLFGDYRDPQDNILNGLDDTFFADAFAAKDFSSPYNAQLPDSPKQGLMSQIEETQNGDVLGQGEVVGAKDSEEKYLGCDKIWDRVRTSEKYQENEETINDLCSQLKSKAKCSGKGAVVEKKDVDKILGPKTGMKGATGNEGLFDSFL